MVNTSDSKTQQIIKILTENMGHKIFYTLIDYETGIRTTLEFNNYLLYIKNRENKKTDIMIYSENRDHMFIIPVNGIKNVSVEDDMLITVRIEYNAEGSKGQLITVVIE